MPGDLRTQIGFITFDSTVHFYSLKVSHFDKWLTYFFHHFNHVVLAPMEGFLVSGKSNIGSYFPTKTLTFESLSP